MSRRSKPQPINFPGPQNTELHVASTWVLDNLQSPGVICPCCQQVAARRQRKLHHSMAAALILLVRFFRENPGERWVHAERYFKQYPQIPSALRGDLAKMTHWGLLEACPEDDDAEHNRSGKYRVTRRGFLFADGRIRVPQSGQSFNNDMVIELDSPEITIFDALNDMFNYWELMGRPRPEASPTGR